MTTIDTLREILETKSAKVLLFAPPTAPVAESMEVICGPEYHEVYDTFKTEERTTYERDRLLVDMQTANVMVMVYDALKPETRIKADRLMLSKSGFQRVAEVSWKAVK